MYESGNKIVLFGGDNFTGGKVVATRPGLRVTWHISVYPVSITPCFPSRTISLMSDVIDGNPNGQELVAFTA